MRKIFSIITIILLISCLFQSQIFANPRFDQEIKVKVNDQLIEFDAKPFIGEQERTMIPIRFVANALGLQVDWDNALRQVTIKDHDTELILVADSINARLNGQQIALSTPVTIRDNRTYLPLRFVAETFNCIVNWNEDTYTVNIVTPFYYVQSYYYFNDIQIKVKGGDEITEEPDGDKLVRTNKLEVKQYDSGYPLVKITLRRDVDAELYKIQLNELKEILELNKFSKEDIQYLYNEFYSLLNVNSYQRSFSANGYNIHVTVPYNGNVTLKITKNIPIITEN